MASVDEDGELNSRGAADTSKSIERSLDGATGVQDVIDEDDSLTVDSGPRNQCFFRCPQGLRGQVVAIHRGVDDCQFGVCTADLFDPVNEPTSEGSAVRGNARDNEVLAAAVTFDDLVGDACQRACDVANSQYLFAAQCAICVHFGHAYSFPASRDGN